MSNESKTERENKPKVQRLTVEYIEKKIEEEKEWRKIGENESPVLNDALEYQKNHFSVYPISWVKQLINIVGSPTRHTPSTKKESIEMRQNRVKALREVADAEYIRMVNFDWKLLSECLNDLDAICEDAQSFTRECFEFEYASRIARLLVEMGFDDKDTGDEESRFSTKLTWNKRLPSPNVKIDIINLNESRMARYDTDIRRADDPRFYIGG